MFKKSFYLLIILMIGFAVGCIPEDDETADEIDGSKPYIGTWKNVASIGGSESDPIYQYYTIYEAGYTLEGRVSDNSIIDGNKGSYSVSDNELSFTITHTYSEGYDGKPKGWNETTSNDVTHYSYTVVDNKMTFTGVNGTNGTLEFEKVD